MHAGVRPAGFDINARGTGDRTILHEAVYGGIEMMKCILQLEGGTNLVNASDGSGDTPLHYVVSPNAPYRTSRLMIELLLQHGADIYARNDCGDTLAHWSAQMGQVRLLRLLIDAGFDFPTRGNSGNTIIHCAVSSGEKIVTYLLEWREGG